MPRWHVTPRTTSPTPSTPTGRAHRNRTQAAAAGEAGPTPPPAIATFPPPTPAQAQTLTQPSPFGTPPAFTPPVGVPAAAQFATPPHLRQRRAQPHGGLGEGQTVGAGGFGVVEEGDAEDGGGDEGDSDSSEGEGGEEAGSGEEGDEEDDEQDEDEEEEEEEEEDIGTDTPQPLPVAHLREIGNLASWTVSTHKPGCGIAALRSGDTTQFWQSDGPQPHLLNIHFFKQVSIVHMRVYLDYIADESYTPTRMSFLAGTGYHDLQQFVELSFERPRGWVDVDLGGVSGGRKPVGIEGVNGSRGEDGPEEEEGDVLRAFLVQVRVAENHQNGKDTHVRGVQLFARGEGQRAREDEEEAEEKAEEVLDKGAEAKKLKERDMFEGLPGGSSAPSWMGEVTVR
ncbi:MAG: anaphase promoting complex subunit doc1 [Vezdaea aestivalis]|nr:MAG: anaphase promoting complex subunit doc1 [Vezdaea aestivalis]